MVDKVEPVEKPVENNNEPAEVDETALFDAVSGAIDEVTITPKEEKPDDGNEDDDGTDTPGENLDDEGTSDGGDDDGAGEDTGNKEDEPEGTPKDKDTPADEPAAKPDEGDDGTPKKDGKTGDEPAAGDEPVGDPDPLNDPIPESTNTKTSERIKSLIELVKGKNDSETQRDEIVERIQSTGTDPEQYANTLGFLQMYNSQDPDTRLKALEIARGVVRELALELGEGSSVTKLSDHEDLAAEVEAGSLTENRALEIAASREQKVLSDSRTAAATARTDDADTTNANLTAGRNQLDVFETAVRTADVKTYAKIRPTFIRILGPVLKRTHPTEWGAAAQEVYDQVKTMKVEAAPKPKVKPKNAPLRPKQGAGGGGDKKPDAETALGAVDDALANM